MSWNYKYTEARAAFKKAYEAQPDLEESFVYWMGTFSAWESVEEHSVFDTLRKLVEKKHPKKAPAIRRR